MLKSVPRPESDDWDKDELRLRDQVLVDAQLIDVIAAADELSVEWVNLAHAHSRNGLASGPRIRHDEGRTPSPGGAHASVFRRAGELRPVADVIARLGVTDPRRIRIAPAAGPRHRARCARAFSTRPDVCTNWWRVWSR